MAKAQQTAGQPEDSATGLAGRVDAVLDRKGFTTQGLRVRAAVAVVAVTVVAAGAGTFLVDNLTNAFGPDSVCGGAVSADLLNDALGPGKVSDQAFGDGHLRNGSALCMAKVSSGVFGDERSVTVELRRNPDLSVVAQDSEARLFGASANGGASGAAFDYRAWALLPQGCDSGQRVTVRADRGERPGAGKLAALAVSTADRIAAQQGCGTSPMPAPHQLSPAGQDHDLDRNAVCGLPGVTVPETPGGPVFRETVTTTTDPLWTCLIHSDANPRSSITFTIGTEPRLLLPAPPKDEPGVGRARWIKPGEMVATCQGRPTYFRMDLNGFWDLVPDSKTTWTQFVTAGGKAIGCEPIL
ncbi:hypothetical protein ACFWJ4_03680 [Kitasatospora sp. NPDC127067]|uniref:hypothetical protein n=1 Tax=Kitasatospora sp. NPDC127067 TaxID=3347126 RepID=UPI00365F6D9F